MQLHWYELICFNLLHTRFVLHLNRIDTVEHGIAELSVVETNPFKHLTHLALKLQPGNDADVKKYLAKCLRKLQVRKRKVIRKNVSAL